MARAWSRRLATTAYLLWAVAALVTALFAWGASEVPPHSEERTVYRLAQVSAVAALALAIGVARRWPTLVLGSIWGVQAGVLLAAVAVTRPFGGIEIDPPILFVGAAGEAAGIVAISLAAHRTRPRPELRAESG
jgi:hypothetical protein